MKNYRNPGVKRGAGGGSDTAGFAKEVTLPVDEEDSAKKGDEDRTSAESSDRRVAAKQIKLDPPSRGQQREGLKGQLPEHGPHQAVAGGVAVLLL